VPVLQGALLCDAARDYGGKVSVLGGFVSILWVPQLNIPAHIWFAGRIGFSAAEARHPHAIQIEVVNENGDQLASVTASMPAHDPSQWNEPELMGGGNLVTPLPFPIRNYGIHFVKLTVDGGPTLVELPLMVRQSPA
jgi:hypothetical protein